MIFVLLLIFAYFVGAIPFGLLIGRLFGDIDIRTKGSGNIGATNVNRILGRKWGAITLACDLLKGVIPVLLSEWLLPDELVKQAWVGFAAFLGHCYPIYLRFRGGKGVATAFGVLAPFSIQAALVGFAVWLLAVRLSRISSLGALSASVVIPLAVLLFTKNMSVFLIYVLMMSILVYRHRENIRRLSRGAEK